MSGIRARVCGAGLHWLALALAPVAAVAQEPIGQEVVAREVIAEDAVAQEAVVLSGGGARGLAHVGALMGLEEMGYDPDMVIGTSMGAVVGALYAAGYAPEEVRARVSGVEWARLFGSTPTLVGPHRDIRHPQFSIDLDLARMRVSRGLLGQWRINHALAGLLFDANARILTGSVDARPLH